MRDLIGPLGVTTWQYACTYIHESYMLGINL